MHVLTWPKNRPLTTLTATISPGRLLLTAPGGTVLLDCQDPEELRAFAMQVYAAALDRDQAIQYEAAAASARRRAARLLAGAPPGLRHRPFTDPPEPPLSVEVPA